MALITGAAGGLGDGLAAEFLRQGWKVAAGIHQKTSAREGPEFWPITLDVTDETQIDAGIESVLERWGQIDVLINNAGIIDDGCFWKCSEADWDRVLSVNLKGAFLCSRAVARPMIRRRDGHIVNISSYSGRVGSRGQANYAAAKAGLYGLTQSLASELGSRNVRVNAVLPGLLATAMTSELSSDQLADAVAVNALGRINAIAEVAQTVCFLASLKNVSGQIFQLDSRIVPWT